ncbi:hypothetical protein CVIRNUC_010717 [Coccomyxa viridis]|uniref:Uncharacterized protein n=1 Tax=Coccomyxa viridis TaxID=1274662 RepID=A0AAV1IMN0_9CHLO|nr:hypothetical protein CVIRNUC_010717 [Coccomyxa viridis]
MRPVSCPLTHGPSVLRIAAFCIPSKTPPIFNAPKAPESARRAQCGAQQHRVASQGGALSEERPQLLQRLAVIACVGLLQLGRPALAAEQTGAQSSRLSESPAESTTAPPSPAAADGKTRLVRSLLLQDGAAEVQPPAPAPVQPSSSPRVQGEGAPEPKPASPATSSGSDQQLPESMLSPSPIPQAPAKGPAPAAQPGPESSAPAASGAKSFRQEEAEKETKKLLDEEEERRKTRRRKKGRIRELEEIRAELAEKELVLLGKEQELLEKDQSVQVLREELDLERKLRTLLTKEKEKAEEEAALAMGLCTGGSIF